MLIVEASDSGACNASKPKASLSEGDVFERAPLQDGGSTLDWSDCKAACPLTVSTAQTLDKWWEAWWGSPNLEESNTPSAVAKKRLSLRHGARNAMIGDYVNELGTDLTRKILGKRTVWVPLTPALEDCFTVVGVLGCGHYGTVKLCEEKGTGQKFACKTICKSAIMFIEEVNELCTEVLTMLKLQSTKSAAHANLLQFYELFDEEDAVHLILDYCDGGDLFHRITKLQRMDERETALIFKQIVSAMLHMHSVGFIHRDLKPENIFLTGTGTGDVSVKVGDFGLSKQLRLGEKTKGSAGTLCYLAPEVIANERFGHPADIWSLGIILYTCLSGRLPFWAETEEGTAALVLFSRPSFSPKQWQNVSQEAKALVLGMLHRNPKKRISLQNILSSDWMTSYGSSAHQLAAVRQCIVPHEWEEGGAPPAECRSLAISHVNQPWVVSA